MENDTDHKILAGALKAMIRVLVTNGNNTIICHMFADGRFYRVEIRIKEIEEPRE